MCHVVRTVACGAYQALRIVSTVISCSRVLTLRQETSHDACCKLQAPHCHWMIEYGLRRYGIRSNLLYCDHRLAVIVDSARLTM
ncbi:hypothetical protein PAXRUDRAFT_829680, partial [Paxillus rubicundulus Ve08.2h10]